MRRTLLVALVALAGCSGMKLDGGCTYTRTVTTAYQCPAEGHLEHYRVAPGGPEP
jgi:hypothetical protein